MEVADECMNNIDVSKFSIFDAGVEISDDCEFPYAIRSQQPEAGLKYSFNSLSFFLKPEFNSLLK